ncbi:MAG: hypothetical protein E7043_03570 [Lentisphaerae bacterium]|nr:hypothetical protein [Lentisphaerota bacterium]
MTIAVIQQLDKTNNAGKFIYCRIENGKIIEKECVNSVIGHLRQFCAQLNSLKVDLLITGMISKDDENLLFESGINLITGISGDPDKTLTAYLNGSLEF